MSLFPGIKVEGVEALETRLELLRLQQKIQKLKEQGLAQFGAPRVTAAPARLFARRCAEHAPARNISNFFGLLAWSAGKGELVYGDAPIKAIVATCVRG